MIRVGYQENKRPTELGSLEIISGKGEGKILNNACPLERIELHGDIIGPILYGDLTFSFRPMSAFNDNQTYEAVFRFPLTGNAAVIHVEARIGSKIIETILREKEAARKTYISARKEGDTAVFLGQESADVFELKLLGIASNEAVTVKVSFLELLRFDQTGGWSLRVPLTLAPRYVRADEEERGINQNPLALETDPNYRFSLQLDVYGASFVKEISHPLLVDHEEGMIRVRLAAGKIIPNQDFVMSWLPVQKEDTTLQAYFDLDSANRLSFMAMVTPPKTTRETLPREITLLVDHSGSMHGAKQQAADWAVEYCLQGLEADELFNLCVFDNRSHWFSRNPVQAEPETVEKALEFLRTRDDGGGTELGIALEQVFRQHNPKNRQIGHVVIITDAEVSDGARLVYLVSKRGKRRLSIVSLDATSNVWLVEEMARQGGGLARYISSEPDADDIAAVIESVMDELNRPVYHDCTIYAKAGDQVVFSSELGDLVPGSSRWITGNIDSVTSQIELLIQSRGQVVASERFSINTRTIPGVRAICDVAKLRKMEAVLRLAQNITSNDIQMLEIQAKMAGFSTENWDSVYPENIWEFVLRDMKDQLVKVSLRSGILSEGTAMIAVTKGTGETSGKVYTIANAAAQQWLRPLQPREFYSASHDRSSSQSYPDCRSVSNNFDYGLRYEVLPFDAYNLSNDELDITEQTEQTVDEGDQEIRDRIIIFDGACDNVKKEETCWLLADWELSKNWCASDIRGISISTAREMFPAGRILIFFGEVMVPAVVLDLKKIKMDKLRPLHVSSGTKRIRFIWESENFSEEALCGLKIIIHRHI